MSLEAPDFYDDLSKSLERAFVLLEDAVVNRHAPFHTPVVSTIYNDADGNAVPRSRVVVLRAFDSAARSFRFHTDNRSDKIADLKERPHISGVFYDPAEKVQLRLTGVCKVDTVGALSDSAWEETRPFSRECYRITPGSGAEIEAGASYVQQPLTSDIDPGRTHFCAVEITFYALEWLYLASHGHRRARFDWHDGGTLTSQWLAP